MTKSLGRLTKNELMNQCVNDLLRIMQLEAENAALKNKVADAAAAFFGRSSEQTPWLFEQFQAAEEAFKEFAEPEKEEEVGVKAHTRKAHKEHECTSLPADTPPDEFEKDGVVYEQSGTREISKVEYVPAQCIIVREIHKKYSPRGGVIGDSRKENNLVAMKKPKIDGLDCTPAFIASAVVNKFDDYSPPLPAERDVCQAGIAAEPAAAELLVHALRSRASPVLAIHETRTLPDASDKPGRDNG